MPMFEFHCTKCNCDFEELVRTGDKVQCPKCKGRKVQKKMSACSHKSSGGKFVSSSGGSGCSSCSKPSCSHCH